MKVGLIGGVNSSFVTLKKLVEHSINVTDVFGYKPSPGMIVSGYNDFETFCEQENIIFHPFTKINDKKDLIVSLNFDVLFVVGISQLVTEEIINGPKYGCIGFHPTLLPKGRGRAPLAWLVKENEDGAANFFLINEEADAGPIFVQEKFPITEEDDAKSAEDKVLSSINKALDKWLPDLKSGIWNPKPQDEILATEYGVRKPDDGLINWSKNADEIINQIRATALPHPGAYSYHEDQKVIIYKAEFEKKLKIKGCIGRILKIRSYDYLIQTGNGVIWIKNLVGNKKIKIGDKFGYQSDDEIFKLKRDILQIKKKLGIYNE